MGMRQYFVKMCMFMVGSKFLHVRTTSKGKRGCFLFIEL